MKQTDRVSTKFPFFGSRQDAEVGQGRLLSAKLACEALGRLGYKAAAHGIVPLVEQTDSVVHVLGGFTALDGQPGQVELLLAGGRTLDAVALNALRGATKHAFDFKGGVTAASRDELVTRAKTWYAAQKAKLPTP